MGRLQAPRLSILAGTVIVLRVTLVDGTYHDIEVPLDFAEDTMDALRNSHIPLGDEWIPTGYGGLVCRSAIISARALKLTAEGGREHHDGNTLGRR